MRFTRRLLLAAGIGVLMDGAAHASTAPTTRPATAPTNRPATDLSSPALSLKSLMQALCDANLEAARACTLKSDHRDEVLRVMIADLSAWSRFHDTATSHFRDRPWPKAGEPSFAAAVEWRLIDRGTVETSGKESKVTPAGGRGTFVLKLVGSEWRVDPQSLLGVSRPDLLKDFLAMYESLEKTADEVGADVRAGKYRDRKAAAADMRKRMADALALEERKLQKKYSENKN